MSFKVFESILIFQLGWWGAVLGAGLGHPLPATGFVATMVILGWIRDHSHREVYLGVSTCLLGILIDGALVLSGAFHFPEKTWLWDSSLIPPLWMILLWPLLMRTLHADLCLGWLKGRYLLAVPLGAVSGILAYWGGVRLGALGWQIAQQAENSGPDPFSLLMVALAWGLALPILLYLRDKLEA